MIRPLTCLCMMLAAGAGLYLYQEKHRAQVLDREIMRVVKATDVARERTGMLRAEWALLNEPERLAALAERHLALKPLSPGQFVQLADLAGRLPAPVIAGSPEVAMDDAAPLEPTTALVGHEPAPLPLPAPAPPIAAPSVAPPSVGTSPNAAPTKFAGGAAPGIAPPGIALPGIAKPVIVKPASAVPTVQIASPVKPPHPIRARPSELGETFATALPPPKPIYVPVMRAVATSALPSSATPPLRAPTLQRAEAVVAQPVVGSSLGMARTMLPPPVPVAVASTSGTMASGTVPGR